MLHETQAEDKRLACVHVCADILLGVDSASDVAPTELDSSDKEEIPVLLVLRVTWAVPECDITCIVFVGKGKRAPVLKRKIGPVPRGTLQDVRPPDEDSEDEDSDDSGGEQLYQPYRESARCSGCIGQGVVGSMSKCG